MNDSFPIDLYGDVPVAQAQAFRRFRETHPNRGLTVEGVWWRYIACGQGDETVLLLPGGSRFAETWWLLIAQLEDDYRILSPSYPPLTTMAAHDRGLAAILDAEHVESPVHVVGASFGGWLAQTFVRRYPQRVKSLVLSGTSGTEGMSTGILRLGKFLSRIYPESVVRVGLKRNIMRTLSPPEEDRAFWDAYFQETLYLQTTKADVMAQHAVTEDFLTSYRFTPQDLAAWPGRILIVEAEDDLAFKAEARRALKRLYPQAQVHTFRDTGHSPGYTRPEAYLAVLRPFLEQAEVTLAA